MFGMLSNLTKAVVSVAVTPITATVDILMIPVDAESNNDAFHRTTGVIKNAGDCFNEAVKPEKDES